MVGHHSLGMGSGFGEMWAHSLRCLNCGAVYDAVVAQNRLQLQEVVSAPLSGAEDSEEEDIYLGAEAMIRPAA
jgi:hypothetical protein